MARDRDWVDYTNLAANVVQTAQLNSINSKMRQMADLEAERDMRQQQEAARAGFEDTIREAVFTYREQLHDVEEIASQNPVAAYIRANHLKRLYAEIPQFKASNFRNYDDKERLANVQRACERLIGDCARRLTTDEREASDQCVDYAFERKELIQLISAQEKREQLEIDKDSFPAMLAKKQAALEKAKEQQRKNKRLPPLAIYWLSVALLALAVVSVPLGFIGLLIYIGYDDSALFTRHWYGGAFLKTALIVGGAYLAIGVIGGLAIRLTRKHVRWQDELAAQVTNREREITEMKMGVALREAEINQHQPLSAKFGAAKAADYRRMQRERDTLMKHMLGSFVKPDFGEKYYNSLDDPPKKIGRWWMRGQEAEGCTFPPVEDVLKTLASRVGSENADWIVRAIRGTTPAGEQAAIELYVKITGVAPAEAQRIIAEVKSEIAPRRGKLGLA